MNKVRYAAIGALVTAVLLVLPPVASAGPAEDLQLAKDELAKTQAQLEKVQADITSKENLRKVGGEELDKLKERLAHYAGRVTGPRQRYDNTYKDFVNVFVRSSWHPLGTDDDAAIRRLVAVGYASTFWRKDETAWSIWQYLGRYASVAGAERVLGELWPVPPGYRGSDTQRQFDALSKEVMDKELALRTAAAAADADIAKDPAIIDAGGGLVDSLDKLAAAVARETAADEAQNKDLAPLKDRSAQLQALIEKLRSRISNLEDLVIQDRDGRDGDTLRRHQREDAQRKQAAKPAAPSAPKVTIAVEPGSVQTAEATDSAGQRTRTYRFLLRAEETAGLPAQVQLLSRQTQPTLEHTTSSVSYQPYGQAPYSLRIGETQLLRGFEGGPIEALIAIATDGQGVPGVSSYAPVVKRLGPEYLTTAERDRFRGVYTAEFQILGAGGKALGRVSVRWEPPADESRPPDDANSPITVRIPSPETLAKGIIRSPGNDQDDEIICRLILDVVVPVPKPGPYRLRIALGAAGERILYTTVKEGQKFAVFAGWVPVPAGPFQARLDVPELPNVLSRSIQGQMQVFGRATGDTLKRFTDALESQKGKVANAFRPQDRLYVQKEMAGTSTEIAKQYVALGHPPQAIETCKNTEVYLQQFATVDPVFVSMSLVKVYDIEAAAAYQTGNAAGVRQAMTKKAESEAWLAEHDTMPGRGRLWSLDAGRTYLKLAERLLMLGAAPAEARALVATGGGWFRKGQMDPPSTNWLP